MGKMGKKPNSFINLAKDVPFGTRSCETFVADC